MQNIKDGVVLVGFVLMPSDLEENWSGRSFGIGTGTQQPKEKT